MIGQTDARGFTTRLEYDKLGRKIQEILPDPDGDDGPLGEAATQFFYDVLGNLQYVTDATGAYLADPAHSTRYAYDAIGRRTHVFLADPDGAGGAEQPMTWVSYDAHGNVLTSTDARGYTTTFVYDELDRKIRETTPDPDGAGPLGPLTTRYFYDPRGNLQYVVNPLGSDAKEAAYTTEFVYDNLGRKIKEILPDPDGTAGPLARPEIAYAFADTGNLQSVTDARGNVTRFLYDGRDRQTHVTDALGTAAGDRAHSTVTAYDAVGNAVLVTDALGHTTRYGYDGRNRVVEEILPPPAAREDSPVTIRTYDDAGNLTSITDPLGYTTWFQYDGLNRQVGVTDASGWRSGDPLHTSMTTFDLLGRVESVTDPLGRTTSFEYDNLSRKIREILPEFERYDSQLVSPTTHFGYDAAGNLKYETDARGTAGGTSYTTYYFYDALGRPTLAVDALGDRYALDSIPDLAPSPKPAHSVLTTYDALGNVASVTDELDRQTSFVYDNLSRKLEEHLPSPGDGSHAAPVTWFGYDANGNLQYQTSSLGSAARDPAYTTWYVYDALNRQTHAIDALDADPSAGAAPYDAAGNLSFTPAHPTVSVYDAAGHLVSITDPEANTTGFTYDALGRLIVEKNELGHQRQYQYDAAGQLLEQTDRNGRVSRYVYDPAGRQVEEQWLDGSSQVFHTIHRWYDPAGQLLGISESDTVTPAAGVRYEYGYDSQGNVTAARMAPTDLAQPSATVYNNTLSGSYTIDWDGDGVAENYYPVSRSLQAGDQVLVSLSSSAFDPVLFIQRPGGSVSNWILDANSGGGASAYLRFTADVAGTWVFGTTSSEVASGAHRLEILVNPHPFAPNVLAEFSYGYDEVGNLVQTIDNVTDITLSSYDALGQLSRVLQSVNGHLNKRVIFNYRDDGQFNTITRESAKPGLGLTADATTTYSTYDGIGRLKAMSHTYGQTARNYTWSYDVGSRITGMTSPDGTSTFALDATNQLTGATHSYQGPESYDYDDNGNRELVDGSISYQTGDANRLLNDGTYTYTYDNEGNRLTRTDDTTGALTEYAWDHRNRLVKVTFKTSGGVKTKEVGYTYDYLGRRIRKTIDSDGNGTVDDYFYNVHRGDELALEFRDQDGLAGQNYNPTVKHRYLYGAAVDKILAVDNAAGQIRWGLADHEGTIRDVVDSAAQLVNHVKFDSFGDHMDSTAPVVDFLFGFTGRPYDPDTELYDYRARWYDPEVGRWLTEDPAGFAAGDVNLYRYAGNSPVMYVDPSGMAYAGFAGGLGAIGNAVGSTLTTAASGYLDAAKYVAGVGAGVIDFGLGTNLVGLGSPTVSLAGGGQLMVSGYGGPTPFQQGASAFNISATMSAIGLGNAWAAQQSWNSQVADWRYAINPRSDLQRLAGDVARTYAIERLVQEQVAEDRSEAAWSPVLGVAQGTATMLNALTDAAIGTFNLPGVAYNLLAPYTARQEIELVPQYDWARGMFVDVPEWAYQGNKLATQLIVGAWLAGPGGGPITAPNNPLGSLRTVTRNADYSRSGQIIGEAVSVTQDPTFIARAQGLGFSESQLAILPQRLIGYGTRAGEIPTGGFVNSDVFLVGRHGLISSRWQRVAHEVGHVLDDVANPGLFERAAQPGFGFGGYYRAESVAYTLQYGFNPAPITALNAGFQSHPTVTTVIVGGSAYGVYQSSSYIFRQN